jgi:ATP-dependent RNA helicase RhlE
LNFSDFGFTPSLSDGLDAMGFRTPTPIQEKSIPAIMNGRDILACAQTGTGKTAAFLLPILHELTERPNPGVDTIIIVPTRELAMQVDQQVEGFSYFTPVSSIAIYGGRDRQAMEQEMRALKSGAPIIVCTPGRFMAHLDMGYVQLDTVRHLILDEADRMLDMGFMPDIMSIVNRLPKKRQTLFFSATMPSSIRKFAKELLIDPVEVNIAISKPAENILQAVYEAEDSIKIPLTVQLLENKKNIQRALIFCSAKRTVKELATRLQRLGLPVGAVHSDLEQDERERQLQGFRSGNIPIIVATDVLSRGIDIKGIDLVLNFDVPQDAEDYVHRIGRTARADASGVAITYVNSNDRRRFQRIEELIETKVRRMPIPEEFQQKNVPSNERRSSQGNRGGSSSGKGRSGGGGRGVQRRNNSKRD